MEWALLALAGAAVIIAIIAWRWPRGPRAEAEQPDLTIVRVGGVGSSAGPTSYVKATLEITNAEHRGVARNWEASIAAIAEARVGIAQRLGPVAFAPTARWHGEDLPPAQSRTLDGWLWVETSSAKTSEVRLPVTLRAEGMSPKTGTAVVVFPVGGSAADVSFEWEP